MCTGAVDATSLVAKLLEVNRFYTQLFIHAFMHRFVSLTRFVSCLRHWAGWSIFSFIKCSKPFSGKKGHYAEFSLCIAW